MEHFSTESYCEMMTYVDFLQAGSSPVSSISGFSVGSGRVDEAVDDFKVNIRPSPDVALKSPREGGGGEGGGMCPGAQLKTGPKRRWPLKFLDARMIN